MYQTLEIGNSKKTMKFKYIYTFKYKQHFVYLKADKGRKTGKEGAVRETSPAVSSVPTAYTNAVLTKKWNFQTCISNRLIFLFLLERLTDRENVKEKYLPSAGSCPKG